MLSNTLKRCLAASAAIFALPVMALNIFVCEPEWEALLAAHAPDADIFSATTAMQDPHYVQARPSLIARMRRADLAMCSGAELEVGWLPMLQNRSGNRAVQTGSETMIFAADHVRMLDTHDHVDRAMGDIHAHGNPHVQFAVNDMPALSRVVSERLSQVDPDNAHQYQANGMRFRSQWRRNIERWQDQASVLQGKKVVGYHATYRYLFDWLGVEQVADLEPKPGLPPTTSHLQSLTRLGKQGFDAIIFSSHQNQRPANWLHNQTGVTVVELPLTVSKNQSLVELYDQVIDTLVKALATDTDHGKING